MNENPELVSERRLIFATFFLLHTAATIFVSIITAGIISLWLSGPVLSMWDVFEGVCFYLIPIFFAFTQIIMLTNELLIRVRRLKWSLIPN